MPGMPGAIKAEREVDNLMGQAAAQDSQFMDAAGLDGVYTDRGIKPLADAITKALPALGMDAVDLGAALDEDGGVSEDLNRHLMMVTDPINDAIEAGVLDADLAVDLDGADEDRDLTLIASRIAMAYADRGFKQWLKESDGEEEEVIETEEQPVEGGSLPDSDEGIEDFFMSRM